MPTVFLLPLAFEPWCHECSSNDYDDDFDVPPVCHPAPMLSPRSSMARPSSPSSVTRFPTKCGVSGSPPKERNSRKHLRDMSDPLAPLFLLDAFKAEQESSSSEETNNNKAVRFAYPLVSSVRECPPRQSSKKEKEILFYTASDIRRFKKERRQINFLCRMAGFHHQVVAQQETAAMSSPSDEPSSDEEDDEATVSTATQRGMDKTGRIYRLSPPPARRRKRKDDDKVLCTPFSMILLQNLFLLNGGLFDVTSQ